MNLSFDDKRKRFDELSLDSNLDFNQVESNQEDSIEVDEQDVIEDTSIEDLTIEEDGSTNSQNVDFEEIDAESSNDNNDSENNDDEPDDNDKKTDTEIVNEYLKPNPRCILCNTPIWSLKLNKAYLDGLSYSQMIDKFSAKFEERANRSLNKSLLQRHFKSHFDVRAAAIAEYNKRKTNSSSGGIDTTTAQRDIFKLATHKYIDELEMFDATSKEMIVKYQELEQLIEEKKNSGKSFGIDELILKQATILNSLNKQAISKFKALSRVDLESKQGQFLSQLGFIGNKAISGLSQMGGKQLLSSQQTEEIYLNVVIKQMLARLEEPLKSTFGQPSKDQKSLFYRELKKSMEGIQDGITVDFERQIKTQTKLITDKQLNQNNQSIQED
jgi:hypothetical protein